MAVAEEKPVKKKRGGLFGWLPFVGRKKKAAENTVEEAVSDDGDVDFESDDADTVVATFEDDEVAVAVEDIEDTVMMDADEIDAVDEFDEELTAVDRTQFEVDEAAEAAEVEVAELDGDADDAAMDFLIDSDGGEDLAANLLTDGEPTQKPEDIDFEDFFADVKE